MYIHVNFIYISVFIDCNVIQYKYCEWFFLLLSGNKEFKLYIITCFI